MNTIRIAVLLWFTVLTSFALGADQPVKLISADLTSDFYHVPKLTSGESTPLVRYLGKVHWKPIPPPYPPIESGDVVGYLIHPIFFEIHIIGKRPDDSKIDINVELQKDFTLQADLLGKETREYKVMAHALKSFRKRIRLRKKADYDFKLEAYKEIERRSKEKH